MSNNSAERLSSISNHLVSKAPGKPDTYRDRSLYKYFLPIQTRWSDNDMYGHINNMYFYQFIASTVNEYLFHESGINITGLNSIQFMIAQSSAQFYAPMSFPASIVGGLVVTKIGRSSVAYRVGIFNAEDNTACVVGEMVHVYVDPTTKRSVPVIPEQLLTKLEQIKS